MKKLTLAALAVLVAGSAVAAESGTVEIRGKVVDQTCVVKTGHKNLVVILPTVSRFELDDDGRTAGKKSFEIDVENCTAETTSAKSFQQIYAAFSPVAPSHVDTVHNGTLFNRVDEAGAGFGGAAGSFKKAKNVNIQLLDKDGNAINLNDTLTGSSGPGGTSPAHPLSTQGNKFTYDAAEPFVTKGKKINGGDLNSDPITAANTLGKKIVGGETVYGASNLAGAATPAGTPWEENTKKYTLTYAAQYYATGVSTAGEVEAFVTYNISYK